MSKQFHFSALSPVFFLLWATFNAATSSYVGLHYWRDFLQECCFDGSWTLGPRRGGIFCERQSRNLRTQTYFRLSLASAENLSHRLQSRDCKFRSQLGYSPFPLAYAVFVRGFSGANSCQLHRLGCTFFRLAENSLIKPSVLINPHQPHFT